MIKAKQKAHRKMGRKMVLKQMGRFLGNSLTVKTIITAFIQIIIPTLQNGG